MHNPHHSIARHYNATWGVPALSQVEGWLSVDPLSDKYPSHSAYNYTLNNPVMLVDPDGRSVEITGDDGKITVYTPGMEYKGKDEFTTKAVQSLNHLYEKGATSQEIEGNSVDVLKSLVESKTTLTTIKRGDETNFSIVTQSDGSSNATITFNPDKGIIFKTDANASLYPSDATSDVLKKGLGRNSPASNLLHEIFHNYNAVFDRKNYLSRNADKSMFQKRGDFPDAEEQHVITRMLPIVNAKLVEVNRMNYFRIYYPTVSPTSTVPLK